MISFYDPRPMVNDYCSIMYLEPLRVLCEANKIPSRQEENLLAVKDRILITIGERLTPDLITKVKENGNFLVVFDINDNTFFTETYGTSDEAQQIDLIFKIAGVQKTPESYEAHIGGDLGYTREKRKFRGGNWGKYFDIVASNKVRSLPYVPWNFHTVDNTPYIGRNKLALVRGGHHYYRVQLYLHLLRHRLVDGNSMFPGKEYVHQFCQNCKNQFSNGGISFEFVRQHPELPCRLKNWEFDFNENCGRWNNSCLPRYFDFAELFNKKYGVDLGAVEQAFHGEFSNGWQDSILNRYLFYADFKYIFSVYAPPRWWEAAEAHTINLVPERTNDQDFFPEMKDGEHYVTYKEDFSNLEEACSIDKQRFEYITNNLFSLYNDWIVGGNGHSVSPNLFIHIMQEIEIARGHL